MASSTQDFPSQLMDWFHRNSNPQAIPIQGTPLNVTLGMSLTAIREVDTTRGEIEILAMRELSWRNPSLDWSAILSESDGAGINAFSMNTDHLWIPDIVAYNAVHVPEILSPPLAQVSVDGTILYVPNERIRFLCDLESFETIEGCNCTAVYGSWTLSGWMLDLNVKQNTISLEDYRGNPRFDILGTYVEKETKIYPCCPESFPDVKFTLTIRRKILTENFFGWKK